MQTMRALLYLIILFSLNTLVIQAQEKDFFASFTDTLKINDSTLMVVDTIKSIDTLVVYLEGKKIFTLSYFSYISALFLKNQYEIDNLRNKALNKRINSEISAQVSWETGAGFYLKYNSIYFSSGLNLMLQRERLAHDPANMIITPIDYQQLDTIGIWGQIINGDTIWMAETEWNTYTTSDTLRISDNYTNSCYYLQIPLMVGKTFSWPKTDVRLSAGIINQFRMGNSAIVFLNETEHLYEVKRSDLRNYKISYCAHIEIDYRIVERIALSGGFAFVRTMHYVKPDTGQLKLNYVSLKMGLRYTW